MDITLPVTYRGLLLTGAVGGPGGDNPISGTRLTRASFSDVSVHGYVEKRSLDDGFDASDVFLGMRSIVLDGEVYAQSKAGLFDALDLLRLKFTPTDAYNEDPDNQGYLPFLFTQPTLYTVYWPTGFVDRVIYARPTTQPEFSIAKQAIGGRVDDGYIVPFVATLQAKDPRFYNPVQSQVPIVGTSGTGTLQNRGSYPAPLSFSLIAAAPAVFTFTGAGTNMTVNHPGGGGYVLVDSVKKVVTYTVGEVQTLRMDIIDFTAGSTWPKVAATPEGDSPVGFDWTCDVALEAGSLMGYQEAWV